MNFFDRDSLGRICESMADESIMTDRDLPATIGDKFFVVDALGVYFFAKFLKFV